MGIAFTIDMTRRKVKPTKSKMTSADERRFDFLAGKKRKTAAESAELDRYLIGIVDQYFDVKR